MSLLPHVDISRLEALQTRLEDLSELNVDFIVLLSGSALIATLGLFQNSPAVVIGAMIIAPLMRPLVCLSLVTLTADTKLLLKALATLIAGTVTAVFLAFVCAQIFRSLEMTDEILARTHPTLLDLGVAIFAGAIGAYCQSKENLADSLAGVAIAVALVPPLCVVGIGIAFGDFSVWSGAALLYATNLVGITAAGAIVFLILGFTPLKVAKRGLIISLLVSAILMVPLALSMRELILENLISSKVRSVLKEKTLTFRTLQLQEVKVMRFRSPMQVTATVLASDQLINSNQVALVQAFLEKEIRKKIEFKLRIIPTREIGAIEVSSNPPAPKLVSTKKAENVSTVSNSEYPAEVIDSEIRTDSLPTSGKNLGNGNTSTPANGVQVDTQN